MSHSGDEVAPATLDRAALGALAEMTGGDLEFLAELIDTFLADGPALVGAMEMGAADGDAATLRRAAHTLKSNARTFGAMTLGAVCQEIEERVVSGGLDGVGGLIERVRGEYPAVVVALEAERGGA